MQWAVRASLLLRIAQCGSALLNLCIVWVGCSVVVNNEQVSFLQTIGYSIALAGFFYYNYLKSIPHDPPPESFDLEAQSSGNAQVDPTPHISKVKVIPLLSNGQHITGRRAAMPV